MASIKIRQRFKTSLQETFNAVTDHQMLSRNLPFLTIEVVKHPQGAPNGLGSIRAMGSPLFRPLKEKVVAMDAPNRQEYTIVGVMKHAITHHYGILEFKADGDGTVVDWHIELVVKPAFMSKLLLGVIGQGIRQGLSREAKKLGNGR